MRFRKTFHRARRQAGHQDGTAARIRIVNFNYRLDTAKN